MIASGYAAIVRISRVKVATRDARSLIISSRVPIPMKIVAVMLATKCPGSIARMTGSGVRVSIMGMIAKLKQQLP